MAEACVSRPDFKETPMKLTAISLTAIAAVAFVAPAFAHHSFAMFDQDKTVTLKGTVNEFEWSNPHVWLRVMVVDQRSGKPVQYAFEMGSVRRSMLDGWTSDSVSPGTTFTLTMRTLKKRQSGG